MQVWEYLNSKLSREKIHLTLIDPNKQSPTEAGAMASSAAEAGTDGVMVGGSTGLSKGSSEATVQTIKDQTSLPVIIFPTNAETISKNADAIFFMSLLNSRNIKYITREQRYGARFIQQVGLETIPMGYIIIAPGMKVGEIGEAELIERNNIEESINYALLAQYFGMRLVYLEAGSGAPEPVPKEMVGAVKKSIDIPLVVGGGIRTAAAAAELARVGADIIVTGTIVENSANIKSTLQEIITTIKNISKETP